MKRGMTALVLLLCLTVGLAVGLTLYCREEFSGQSEKHPDAYMLDAERINGTDAHVLELEKGDTLVVRFETERGALRLDITAPDKTLLYAGNGKEATEFTLTIPQSGVYTVRVKAQWAKGKIYIQKAERHSS